MKIEENMEKEFHLALFDMDAQLEKTIQLLNGKSTNKLANFYILINELETKLKDAHQDMREKIIKYLNELDGKTFKEARQAMLNLAIITYTLENSKLQVEELAKSRKPMYSIDTFEEEND